MLTLALSPVSLIQSYFYLLYSDNNAFYFKGNRIIMLFQKQVCFEMQFVSKKIKH